MCILQSVHPSLQIAVLLRKLSNVLFVDIAEPLSCLLSQVSHLLSDGAEALCEALPEWAYVLVDVLCEFGPLLHCCCVWWVGGKGEVLVCWVMGDGGDEGGAEGGRCVCVCVCVCMPSGARVLRWSRSTPASLPWPAQRAEACGGATRFFKGEIDRACVRGGVLLNIRPPHLANPWVEWFLSAAMLPPFAASSAPRPPPTIFVTVGSTAFSPLIARVLSPTVLSLLPPNSKLLVQYGKSDLASILAGDEGILTYSSPAPTTAVAKAPFTSTSAGFTQIDAGSEFHPEAGLRKTQQGGYSWKGSTVKALDPGRTGRIQGWELLDGRREEDQGQGTQTGMRRRRRRRRPRRSTEDQATKAGSSSSTSSASSSGSSSSAEENRREDPPSRAAPPHGSAGATILTSPPTLNFKTAPPHDVCITLMAYVPSLTPHLKEADLVVAHAGESGVERDVAGPCEWRGFTDPTHAPWPCSGLDQAQEPSSKRSVSLPPHPRPRPRFC